MRWVEPVSEIANRLARRISDPARLRLPRTILIILISLILASCAPYHQTLDVVGYKPSMMIDGQPRNFGHSEQRLGQGWYRVRVSGHANTPKVWLKRIAEARAGELTLNAKQTHFLVESTDTLTNCSLDVTKLKQRDKKKDNRREEPRFDVLATGAERVVYLTIRMTRQPGGSNLLDAQQTFSNALKTLAGPQPLKAEKHAAYESAMQHCRAIARDKEEELNRHTSNRSLETWSKNVTVRH